MGKRGTTWKIKFTDAAGRQVKETLGREEDGWTEKLARAELDARLVDVRREGLTKPTEVTFGSLAEEWVSTYPVAKGLKRSTRLGYETIVRKNVIPALGHIPIGELDVLHLEHYLAKMQKGKAAPRTRIRHLNVIHAVLAYARRLRLIRENVAELVQRPTEPRLKWRILTPVEIARVERAFTDLIAEAATEAERRWCEQARVVFITVYGTGLRRSEVMGLRWKNVHLADPAGPRLRVCEMVVRGKVDTPKSVTSERTLALGPRVAAELFEHRGRSAYQGDDERVFCHPDTNGALDDRRYAVTFRAALAKAGVTDYMRPFHDGRHTAITNDALSGNSPAAIQARAGHAHFGTTQRYINLAGVTFREEAERAEARMFGTSWVPEMGTANGEPVGAELQNADQ